MNPTVSISLVCCDRLEMRVGVRDLVSFVPDSLRMSLVKYHGTNFRNHYWLVFDVVGMCVGVRVKPFVPSSPRTYPFMDHRYTFSVGQFWTSLGMAFSHMTRIMKKEIE